MERGIGCVTSLQNHANQCIDVASKRKKQRNGTGGEQSASKSETKKQKYENGGEQSASKSERKKQRNRTSL